MTCSLALRKCRLRDPEYPSAFSSTARRCFLPWTARLTRAMTSSPSRSPSAGRRRDPSLRGGARPEWSGAAEHALDVVLVASGHFGAPAQATRPPARLLLEQVRSECLAAPDLAGPGDLEALGGAAVRLDLRHLVQTPSVASAGGASRDPSSDLFVVVFGF